MQTLKETIRLLAAGGIGISCALAVLSMDDADSTVWINAVVGWGVCVFVFLFLTVERKVYRRR